MHTLPRHLKPGAEADFLKLLQLYSLGVLTLSDVQELIADLRGADAPDSVFEHLG